MEKGMIKGKIIGI